MRQSEVAFAAADLGATSGRVILGILADGRFTLREVRRFQTPSFTADGHLHWDADRLTAELVAGFDAAVEAAGGALASIGIDTWGVDYGRFDAAGSMLEQPFNYRDARTDGLPEQVFELIPADVLYARCGLQVMPFNTIFQLVAAATDERWGEVDTLLLLPDLFAYRLTGRRAAEVTVASTTGLLDVATRRWSGATAADLAARYGLPLPRILPELVEPGTVLGDTTALSVAVPLVAVGGHDTASAVVAVPAVTDRFAFISSGTWSLVGLELDRPVLTEESRAANFTNELGVDGTVRYLKNVMGLWVLIETMRGWEAAGHAQPLLPLLAAAAAEPAMACVVDMNDDRLLPPGDMPARLAAMAAETGQECPTHPAGIARVIIDSLALAYRRSIRDACRLAGKDIDVVHIVGGGCQNTLLCQLTADATGLPVVAGPAEGTAIGNLLVQARATGHLTGDLMALRRVARASADLLTYAPGATGIGEAQWADAERRAGLA